MFSFCPTNYQIPTLTFTKAELVYALSVLMADISPTDNSTRLEMVEVRYYLNKIKDRVEQAAADGTLERAMRLSDERKGEDTTPRLKAAPMPSMAELRERFPNLTEDEIKEVFNRVREERQRDEEKQKEREAPTPISTFIAEPPKEETAPQPTPKPMTIQEEKNRENSRKFANMLGSL